MVHLTGIEPACLSTMDPKSIVSTNSTTDAYCSFIILNGGLSVNRIQNKRLPQIMRQPERLASTFTISVYCRLFAEDIVLSLEYREDFSVIAVVVIKHGRTL